MCGISIELGFSRVSKVLMSASIKMLSFPHAWPMLALPIVTIMMFLTAGTFVAQAQQPFPCPSPTYVDSAPSNNFPLFPGSNIQRPSLPFVENHFSEVAIMARPPVRAVNGGLETLQANCPHSQGGLKLWHDPATWGGSIPNSNGANVVLPSNSKILISSCSIDPNIVLGTITIPATSELIFADAPISIRANGFNVLGALRIGSPSCRLKSRIIITLHGSRNAQPLSSASPSLKGFDVQGQIDIHGAQYSPTWTRLALTANVGDSTVYVQDVVNWEIGQQIVITTTEVKDSRDFNRNSVVTIQNVQRIGDTLSAIEITPPLSFKHYGGREYQAEVALLSRRITVQGDEANSEPEDINPSCRDPSGGSTFPCVDRHITGFGAHILVNGPSAIGRFSGLEVFRGGQTNVLARYSIHFHLMGNVTPQRAAVKDCSVHHSFFRAFAVHGTSGALVTESVAFDIIGHAFFLEDGVEENNIFSYDLAAHIHPIGPIQNPSLFNNANGGGNFFEQVLSFIDESPNLILPSDLSASGFYITNPSNTFLGCAASGGWAGFGFPGLPRPVKLHENVRITPKDRPLTLFKGNTAHSSGYWWASAGAIYIGGELRHKFQGGPLTYTAGRAQSSDRHTCSVETNNQGYCIYQDQLWMRFEDVKIFLVNSRGIQHWGARGEFVRLETWDTVVSLNVFGDVLIQDNLHVCRSLNHVPTFFSGCLTAPNPAPLNPVSTSNCNIRDTHFWKSSISFQFYDVSMRHILQNVEFRNCDWQQFQPCLNGCTGGSVFEMLTHSSQFVPEVMQATMGIRYVNTPTTNNVWRFSTPLDPVDGITISGRLQSWSDVDGTASGTGVRTMLGSARTGTNNWWRYNEQCFIREEMWVCPLRPGDSAASILLKGVSRRESDIGVNKCMNGREVVPAGCPIVGTVTHFGRAMESDSLNVGLNAKLTGPVIKSQGGWFLRLNPETGRGTPKQLILNQIQVMPDDDLVLGISYPSTSTFTIRAQAAPWCNPNSQLCSFTFNQVSSLDQVRNGDGSQYFFASSVLYVKAVTMNQDGLAPRGGGWRRHTANDLQVFSRVGVTLPLTMFDYNVIITANNCGSDAFYCDLVPNVIVPPFSGLDPSGTQPPSPTLNNAPIGTRSPSSQRPNQGAQSESASSAQTVGVAIGSISAIVVVAAIAVTVIRTNSRQSNVVETFSLASGNPRFGDA